jgi:hypothetical protein
LDADQVFYVKPPKSFEHLFPGVEILRLLLPLYGLRVSPKLWFEKVDKTLRGGFIPLPEEPCIYRRGDVYVQFYVDDFSRQAKARISAQPRMRYLVLSR